MTVALSTFADVVAARAGDPTVGLRCGDQAWTWGEVVDEARARAAFLLAAPAPPGRARHVGVLLGNEPDYVFWICAAALSGSVVVGINPTRRGAELAADVRHTDTDLLVTNAEYVGRLRDAGLVSDISSDGGLPTLLVGTQAYAVSLAPHRGAALPTAGALGGAVDPNALLLLLFSSGSTGTPKAVICSQGRLARLAVTLRERTGIDRDAVTYLCMPLYHGNSLMLNLAPALLAGATVCLAPRFSASGFSADIHRYGVTFVNYVGRALSYVLAQPVDPRDATSSLRLAQGTEASVADAERFAQRFGCVVAEGYGMSEGVLRINRTPETPADALGLPVGEADVQILDPDTGAECPRASFTAHGRLADSAAIGEIVVRGGAASFEGYYAHPAAMAERVRGEDFWTGDLGWRDEAGWFYFAGRSSDRLRVDSENFAAAPVERILERWPEIAVACVYAVPDARTGDQVMCALQVRPGGSVTSAGLIAHLTAQRDLGVKAWPRYVRLCADLPTTGNGKVAKTVLRSQGWNTADPIWHCARPGEPYVPFDAPARAALEAEFAAYQRSALLPPAVAPTQAAGERA